MGKVAVKQQKLQNARGRNIGGVDLAIGFKGGAAAQQSNQLKILVARVLALSRMKKIGLINLEQRGRGVGALQVASQANELPSLPVNHSGVADALEKMNAVNDRREHIADAGGELHLRLWRMNLMEEPVESLPLLGGDFLAHLASVLARAVDAESDGGMVEIVKDQLVRHRLQIAVPLQAGGLAERGNKPLPAPLRWPPPVSSIRPMVTSSWRTVFSARSR